MERTGREDADYPELLKTKLQERAPILIYGCGEKKLLQNGGLAVVGSRGADAQALEFTQSVGHLAAAAGVTIISGGAKGVDQAALDQTIRFSIPGTNMESNGFEATLLLDICDAYLRARDDGELHESQEHLARKAETITRACAKVGIIALIDEATGFQKYRAERELQFKLQENHHMWLKKFGRGKVRDQILQVIPVMKLCNNIAEFKAKFAYVFKNTPLQLSFDENWIIEPEGAIAST